jgi:hypothetical protein
LTVGAHLEPAALHQMRRLVLAVVLLGTSGLLAELLFIEHLESWQQTVPLVALGAGFALGGLLAVRPGAAAIRAFQWLMGAFVVIGLAGLYLHYIGNVEFERERNPALGGVGLAWESLRGATPALAPGAMVQLGLLGLVFAFRHPALARGRGVTRPEEAP